MGKYLNFKSFFFCISWMCATYVADFVYEYVHALCTLSVHSWASMVIPYNIAYIYVDIYMHLCIPNREQYSRNVQHTVKKVKVLTFIYRYFKNAIFNQIDLTVKRSTLVSCLLFKMYQSTQVNAIDIILRSARWIDLYADFVVAFCV